MPATVPTSPLRLVWIAIAVVGVFALGVASASLLTEREPVPGSTEPAAPPAPDAATSDEATDDAVTPADAEPVEPAASTAPEPEAAPRVVETADAEPEDEPQPNASEGAPDELTVAEPAPEPVVVDDLAAPSQCPGSGALPADVVDHRLAGGDVDGDGDVDTIHGYRLDGVPTLQVSFTGGGGATVALDDADLLFPTQPLDGIDVNGDGRDEILVSIGGGAKGLEYAVFSVAECGLVRRTLGGEAFSVSESDTIGALVGFGCRDIDANGANDVLITYEMVNDGEGSYYGSVLEYVLLPDDFSQIAQGPIVYDPQGDVPLTEWFPCDGDPA